MSKVFTLAYGGIGAGVVSQDIITNNPPPPSPSPLYYSGPDLILLFHVYTQVLSGLNAGCFRSQFVY